MGLNKLIVSIDSELDNILTSWDKENITDFTAYK